MALLTVRSARNRRWTGLVTRLIEQTLADTLAWRGNWPANRAHAGAGLADQDERALLDQRPPLREGHPATRSFASCS